MALDGKAKETYDAICKCQEVLYNNGVMDGVTLIRDMIVKHDKEKPEEELTKDDILIACDEFLQKYNGEEKQTDEMPREYAKTGMSEEAYRNLMAFQNEENPVPSEPPADSEHPTDIGEITGPSGLNDAIQNIANNGGMGGLGAMLGGMLGGFGAPPPGQSQIRNTFPVDIPVDDVIEEEAAKEVTENE